MEISKRLSRIEKALLRSYFFHYYKIYNWMRARYIRTPQNDEKLENKKINLRTRESTLRKCSWKIQFIDEQTKLLYHYIIVAVILISKVC